MGNKKLARVQDDNLLEGLIQEMLDLIWMAKHGSKFNPAEDSAEQFINMEMSPEDFDVLLQVPRFRDILSSLDIASEDQCDLFETLDVNGGGTIDIGELVLGINRLRGDPRRADIVSVGLGIRNLLQSFQEFEKKLDDLSMVIAPSKSLSSCSSRAKSKRQISS